MQAALDRSQSKNKAHDTRQKEFNSNSRRLLKDLESKGIVRTAVETINLALHADNKDKSRAECFRTFPTIMFPVAELLSREEIENGKKHGFAVIKTIHTKNKKQSFIDAPIDLLYGFRGKSHNVTLLSPYEMIRYWQATEIKIPTKTPGYSEWTEEGLKHKDKHKEECKDPKKQNQHLQYIPGTHFKAIEKHGRILMPDFEHLSNLRHKWCWERRKRPHVPLWTNAKLPRQTLPIEENARIISVCMRPWTLNHEDVSTMNPLLTALAETVMPATKTTQSGSQPLTTSESHSPQKKYEPQSTPKKVMTAHNTSMQHIL